MRKLTAVILAVVMALSMGLLLASCVPNPIVLPDDQNPDKIPVINGGGEAPAAMTAFEEILASLGASQGAVSFNIGIPVRLNDKSYSVTLLGNIPTEEGDSLEMNLTIGDGAKTLFGLYVFNGKLFIEVFDEYKQNSVKIHVEDIDVDYVVGILKKLNFDAVKGAIDGLLGGIGMTVDSIIGMVVPLLFTVENYSTASDISDIKLVFSADQVLGLVSSLLGGLNLDTVIPGVNVNNLSGFVADLLNMIPEFTIDIHSVIRAGKSELLDISVKTDKEVFGLNANVDFGASKLDISMPEDIESYQPFSITNIAFNISLGIHTNGFDIGKFINTFMPGTLPEGLLVFTSDRELTLKVNIDLDPEDNKKNLILLELYNGRDVTAESDRLLGAYFIDGVMRINVTDISGAVDIPNIELRGLNISGLISGVVDMLTSTIDGAIDSLFGGSEVSETSIIVPANVGYNGDPIISADLSAFIQSITSVFRMSDYVKLENNALTIDINEDFFTELTELVDALKGNSVIEMLKNIGSVRLAVNLAPWGIDNVDLTYRPLNDDNYINLNINSFLIGFSTPDLESTIRSRTAGKEYVSNVADLLAGALDGIELEADFKLKINKGQHDLSALFGDLIALPPIDFDVPEDVLLDLGVKVQASYDYQAPENTKALLEITLKRDISVFKAGLLLGLYIKGSDMYLTVGSVGDISIPKIKIKTDFMTLLTEKIKSLEYDLNFEGMLEGLLGGTKPQQGPAAAAYGAPRAVNGGTAYDGIENIVDLNINKTTLTVAVTALALQKLLAAFGVDIPALDIDLRAELTDINDASLELKAFGMAALKIDVTYANIGRAVNVDLPYIDENEYVDDLHTLINGLLKGVDLEAELELKLNKGFDLAAVLREMQLPLPIDMDLSLSQDMTIGVNLKLQMVYDANNSNNNKFKLELSILQDFLFFRQGKFITAYGTKDGLYIDIAPIDNIKIPRMKIDIDIMSMLNGLLEQLKTEFIINIGGGNTGGGNPTPTAAGAVAPDNTTILLKQHYIQLYVTGNLIMELLKQFVPTMSFRLPEFDLTIDIGDKNNPEATGFNGIYVNFGMGNDLSLDLRLTELTAGRPVSVDLPQLEGAYIDNIAAAAKEMLKGVDIFANLNITLHAGEMNLSSIMQLFGVPLPDTVINITEQTNLRASLRLRMQYDENSPKNSKILLEIFIKDNLLGFINGSETVPFIQVYGIGGALYMQMNNLNNIEMPKVKLDFDLFELIIKELEKINIQELIYGQINPAKPPVQTGIAAVAAADVIEIFVNNDSLKLAATLNAIMNVIKIFNPNITLDIPNFDLSLELNGLHSIKINADKFMNAMTIGLEFGVTQIGGALADPIAEPAGFNVSDYDGNLRDTIENILDGIHLEGNISLKIKKGVYDLSEILNQLIDLPPMVFSVAEDTTLDLTLRLLLSYDKNGYSKGLFELILNQDVAFAKAGVLLRAYIEENIDIGEGIEKSYIFIEVAEMLGVKIPKIKIEFDVFGELKKIINEKLNINYIINSGGNAPVPQAVNAMVYGDGIAEAADITLGINPDSLKLAVTANAIAMLLSMIQGFDIVLPPIDVTAEISALNNIKLGVKLDRYLSLDLAITEAIVGDVAVRDKLNYTINPADYAGDLKNTVKSVLEGIDIEANLAVKLLPGEHDFSTVLSMFGVTVPPIIVTIEGTEPVQLDVSMRLKYGKNAAGVNAALFEIVINNDLLLFNGGKKLIGLYAEGAKTYVELSPDGAIDGVKGIKVALDLDLFTIINGIIDKIAVDFVINNGVVSGNTTGGGVAPAAMTFAGETDKGSIGVSLNQSSIQLAVTAKAIQALLDMFGLSVGLPDFDITLGIDAINGITISVNALNMIGADLKLKSLNIGKPVVVTLPPIDDGEYAYDLNKLVNNLLVGAELKAGLQLTITKDFNINDLIKAIGVPIDMPPINITIPNEGITLDAEALLQLKYDPNQTINNRALFEIWIKDAPILFDIETLKSKPFIGIYVEGKYIYAEINGIKGVSVPKVMLECDFLTMLNDAIKSLNINFTELIFPGNGGNAPAPQVAQFFALPGENINISINQNTLALGVTLNAIAHLLEAFGLQLTLPDIDLSLEADIQSLNNINIGANAGVAGKNMLEMNLHVSSFRFGDAAVNIDLSDKILRNETGDVIKDAYNGNLQSLLADILSGVNIEMNLRLKINQGFSIKDFLDGLGITIPNLNIEFKEDIVIDVTLKAQVKYDANSPMNSRAKIEIIANESIQFINKGLLLGVYISGNEMYIRLGESFDPANPDAVLGGIAGITVPTIKLNTDIIELLDEQIKSLDVNFVIDAKNPINPFAPVALTEAAAQDQINVTINKDALRLKATALAIQNLLEEFNLNLNFVLPDFDLTGEIKGLDDISLSVNHNDAVFADISLKNLKFGDKSMNIELPDFSALTFSDDASQLILDVLKGVDIEGSVQLTLKGGVFDIADIVKSFGLSLPSMPITIDGDNDSSNGYQDIILDITLRIKLSLDAANPNNSKGVIELIVNRDIAIFKAGKLLSVYIDGGNMYIEADNIEGVKIPKLKIHADLVSVLTDALINLSNNFELNIRDLIPTPAPAAAISEETLAVKENVSISINRDALQVKATAAAISALLNEFGASFAWPDIDITAELRNINGATIYLNLNASAFKLAEFNLTISRAVIGKPVDIDLSSITANDYSDSVSDIVQNMLTGIDITGNADISLPAGKYDFASFLQSLGLTIPPLAVNMTNDVLMKTKFVFKTAYDVNDPSRSKAIIELIVTNPNDIIFIDKQNRRPDGSGGEEVVLLGFYLENNTTYLDLSNIIIANIRLPKLKVSANLFTKVVDILESLGLDLSIGGGSTPPVGYSEAGALDNADFTLSLSKQAVYLNITSKFIGLLLEQFGMTITLPDIDLTVDINQVHGINLNAGLDFGGKTIVIDLNNIKANFGTVPAIDIPEGVSTGAGYGESIGEVILNFLNDVDVSGVIDLQSAASTVDISSIVNSILATLGEHIDIPINLNMDNFSNKIYFEMKWHLEKNDPRKSEAAIALYTEKGGLAITIYLNSGTLYVDLSSLGLMQFHIDNFNFTGLLEGLFEKFAPILTKSFDQLLDSLITSNINTVSSRTEAVTPEQLARETKSYNVMAQAMAAAENGEEVLDLLTVIFRALDITDTVIKLDFAEAFINELINKAGVYLGLDLYGDLAFDFIKGTLDGSAQINEISLKLDFDIKSIGDFGSMKNKITYYDFTQQPDAEGKYPSMNYVPNTSKYSKYELFSTKDLLISVLGNVPGGSTSTTLEPLGYIDMYNGGPGGQFINTYKDEDGYGTGGTLRIFIERVTKYDDFAGAVGNLKISIYKDFQMTQHVAFVAVMFTERRIQILGGKDLFNVIGITGTVVNTPVAVDLLNTLSPLLDPILQQIPDSMYINDMAANNGLTEAAGGDINIGSGASALGGITDYLKAINVNMYQTGTTKVNVALNGVTLDKLLVDMLHELLYNIEVTPGSGPSRFDYKGLQSNAGSFYDNLWNRILKPFITNINSALGGVSGLVKDHLRNTVLRILPLPRFDEAEVSITLANSRLQSIKLATEYSAIPSERLRLNIYPADAANLVSWGYDNKYTRHNDTQVIKEYGYIPGAVVYDPYSTEKITTQFENRYALRNVRYGGAHRILNDYGTKQAQQIVYGGDFNLLKSMDESGVYTPGVYNITATAYGETINIPVTVISKKPIKYIEDVIVQGYGDLPDQVTAVFEDGTKRLIKGVIINSSREGYGERLHNTTVTLGGETFGVNVHYTDSTIIATGENGYMGNISVDAYSMNSLLTKLPSRIFFRFASGYWSSREVEWSLPAELTGLTQNEWIHGGFEFDVYATIPDGTSSPQQLKYRLKVLTTEIAYVAFDNEYENDFLSVDPYKALQEQALAVTAANSGVFPSKVSVTYRDGRTQTVDITWSNNNYDYTLSGNDNASATISNITGDYKWTREIRVKIMARLIKYASFGTDAQGNDIRILNVLPYNYMSDPSILPTTVKAVFVEGEPVDVPCEWIIPPGTIDIKGGYKQVTLKIMPGTTMETTVKPIIYVKPSEIESVNLPVNPEDSSTHQYTLDMAYSVYYNAVDANTLIPKSLPFILKSGAIIDIGVTSADFSRISVTAEGGRVSKVRFTIVSGEEFYIDVVIPRLTISGLALENGALTMTSEEMRAGQSAYPTILPVYLDGDGEKKFIDVASWKLDNVTIHGGVAQAILRDGSKLKVKIIVTDEI